MYMNKAILNGFMGVESSAVMVLGSHHPEGTSLVVSSSVQHTACQSSDTQSSVARKSTCNLFLRYLFELGTSSSKSSTTVADDPC
jgi:hypothetical protein